jgi:hypothetical protein
MIILYHGGGATLTGVGGNSLPEDEWSKKRTAVRRILSANRETQAAQLFDKYPFELLDGINDFSDEFSVLYASVPLDSYLEFKEMEATWENRLEFSKIAKTISEIGPYVRFIAVGLDTDEKVAEVMQPSLKVTSEAVEKALADAEELIRSKGPSHAVDRVHTALHGYLQAVLLQSNIPFAPDASITALFKLLREKHAAFKHLSPHSSDMSRVSGSLSTIIDALNTLRNNASGVHPTTEYLEDPEAMLVINAVRAILRYIDEKLG